MKVQIIKKAGPGMTGTDRYTASLIKGLSSFNFQLKVVSPELNINWPWLVTLLLHFNLDLRAFFASYPLRVSKCDADIYHIVTQTMGTLLMTQRFDRPVVVTVHDIIPYLTRHNPILNIFRHPIDKMLYHLALYGLRRAQAIIAVSEWTRRTLVEILDYPPGRIFVIPEAVDTNWFSPQAVPDNFLERYGLNNSERYILYVGSDDPRKSLSTLLRALAMLRQDYKNVRLICVGGEKFPEQDRILQALILNLDLQEAVLQFERLLDEDLPLFYNLAAVFVMPSLYEGFGLPVLEAMACGTPVVCTNRTSLPELVGGSALLVSPETPHSLAQAIGRLLDDSELARHLREAGRQRALTFTLNKQTESIAALYKSLVA